MQAVIRQYSGQGAKELIELLAKHTPDLERVLRSVPGFVSYTLVRTAEGGVSVTVCHDQAGADVSSQKAREWIAQHASSITAGPPNISGGEVIMHLK